MVRNDPKLDGFVNKTSIGPLFEALAEKCADTADGAVAMVRPTIVSYRACIALRMRQVFARRFHIHTLLTCHQPGEINFSQNTSINESLIVARRHDRREGPQAPQRESSAWTGCQATIKGRGRPPRPPCPDAKTGPLSDGWGRGFRVAGRAHRGRRLDGRGVSSSRTCQCCLRVLATDEDASFGWRIRAWCHPRCC